MREILFRAKAINRDNGYHRTDYKNGDWVYGLISRPYKEMFPTLPMEFRNENGVDGIEVDYKTVGQFTGLTDKNGVKIFEGDILQEYNGEDRGYIRYDEADGMYFLVVDNVLYDFSTCNSKWYEVIGNIHDNKVVQNG